MLNHCCFIGRLGGDPEMRYTQNGDAVCNFTVACGEKYKAKSGEMVETTEWVRVVVWRKLAEICGEYLKKGALVYISGKMQTRQWEDKDGAKKYTTEIVAAEMKMLGGKSDCAGQQNNATQQRQPVQQDDDVPF